MKLNLYGSMSYSSYREIKNPKKVFFLLFVFLKEFQPQLIPLM